MTARSRRVSNIGDISEVNYSLGIIKNIKGREMARIRHVVVPGAVILVAGCAGAYGPPSAEAKQTATVTSSNRKAKQIFVTPSFAEQVVNANFY